MTFSLLNPALLIFTALLAVPVLAHLFTRAKPKEFSFPSLQWLRQVERKTTNFRRPKDWLLLLLRLLAVAAILAAFLQPLLFNGAQLAAVNARKTIVIVVDRSASMGFVEQGQSRFVRGTALASEVLKSAGSQTLANLVWLDAVPNAEFPDPAVNVDALREVLRRGSASEEPGEVNEALRIAMEQLGRGEGARELYVVSDFQASAWKQAVLSIPPNVRLFQMPVATTEAANAALTSLTVQPERPVTGTEERVLCRVRNFSGAELKTSVQLSFAEVRQSRAVTLPAWGEGVAEFRVLCGAAGSQSITAALPEDAFPADDRRFATIEIRESWRVKVDGPADDASLILWQRALASLGWLDLKSTVPEPPEVHLAVHAPASRAADLRESAERGATVICQPGEDWNGSAWMALWGASAKQSAITAGQRDRAKDKPWTMLTLHDDSALWTLFRSGEYGDPAGGNVWKRLNIAVEKEQILIGYDDGAPALAAQRVGKGWLLLWNIELDETVSDRVQQPSFLVLLGEMLLQHGQSCGTGDLGHFVPPQSVFWQPQQPLAADQVRLQDEKGSEQPFIHDTAQSPPVFRAREPLPMGSYKWLLDGQTAQRASVNFPADAESDLRCLDPATLGAGKSLSLSAAAALTAQRDGLPLWPWCVAAALFMLGIEGFLARNTPRSAVA